MENDENWSVGQKVKLGYKARGIIVEIERRTETVDVGVLRGDEIMRGGEVWTVPVWDLELEI